MPYKDRVCQLCLEFVKGCSYVRHMKRHHGEDTSDDDDIQTDSASIRSNHSDGGSTGPSRWTRVKSVASSPSSTLSPDYICNAVLCMLRRTEGVNLPAMSDYLSAYFPAIPGAWHMAVIVSAFAAAQKVAATYGDIILNADDDRIISAKRSLARWTHGLSAVEPGFRPRKSDSGRGSRDSSASSTLHEPYSPTTNYLIERQLPVPLESQFQQQQMSKEFEQCDASINCTEEEPRQRKISKVDQILSTVAVSSVNQALSMPLIDLDTDVSVSHVATAANATSDEPINISQGLIVDSVTTTKESVSEEKSSPGSEAVNRQTTSTPLLDEPCTPHTFMDLLDVHDIRDDMIGELTQPLSVCLSPLHTPMHDSCDKINAEPILQLHPSPHPSLEDVPSSRVVDEALISSEVSNVLPEEEKELTRKKKASPVVTVSADKATEDPDKVKPAKKVAKLMNNDQKENLKRTSNEEELSVRKLKRPKDSLVKSAMLSDKKSRNTESSGFKIPLKPSQEQVAHSSSNHDRPALTGTHKEKSGGYWNERDQPNDGFRHRPSATDFQRFSWNTRRQHSSGYHKDCLMVEQLCWLDRMPTGWHR